VEELIMAREQGLLAVVEEGDSDAFPQLDAGESAVLSAAAAAKAAVLLDERRARAVVAADSQLRAAIPAVSGIAGLILLAKQRGRIPEVRPLLEDLVRQQFRIRPALLQTVLEAAGEA
jgi:predicted nucleic acid-binding protein